MMMVSNTEAQTQASQQALDAKSALELLRAGNGRFLQRRMYQRDLPAQVKQTASGQFPFAAVLSCIDSRVPVETVLDQGIGDLFSVRIAGNFVNPDILGSLEFACKVAGSKLIVVMGHTSCGAVKGACDKVVLGNLTGMLEKIEPAVAAVTDIQENRNSSNAQFVQRVAEQNVRLAIQSIRKESEVLREMEEHGEIEIIGAMYHVDTGRVDFHTSSADALA